MECQDVTMIAIIFDFDNTLIDSRINFAELRASLIDQWAARSPLPAAREELMRHPLRDLVDQAAAATPDLAPSLWATIERYEAEGLAGATAMPHAREVLEHLAARGFRLALLTNNARPATHRLLQAMALTPLLDLAMTRDDVPALKPDPSGIRLIVERLGPLHDAYMVGDSWIDGLAAEGAGVRFIGFGERRAEVESRGVVPWAWISDLRELLNLDLRQ
jgi:phosphoglycolate phosphatase